MGVHASDFRAADGISLTPAEWLNCLRVEYAPANALSDVAAGKIPRVKGQPGYGRSTDDGSGADSSRLGAGRFEYSELRRILRDVGITIPGC